MFYLDVFGDRKLIVIVVLKVLSIKKLTTLFDMLIINYASKSMYLDKTLMNLMCMLARHLLIDADFYSNK